MALDKTGLKNSIKTMLQEMGSAENQEAAIEKFATDLSDAIDTYVKSASIFTSQANITAAVMMAGAYPVTVTSNLECIIQ